ncbi:MAG: hypothetical protein HKO57_01185, partial [Akkermansiaceae bacterium]|nr:hypothetical protein [Akkermansiaceae bacterium]
MTHLRSIATGLLAIAAACLCPPAAAQDEDLRQFDPSDVYFQAWLTIRDAESLQKSGSFLEAYTKFEKAKRLFDNVALYNPEWKPHLVQDRQKSTQQSLDGIREKALAEQKALERQVHGLVEGGEGVSPQPAPPGLDTLGPEERRKIAALQKNITHIRSQLGSGGDSRDANAARLRRELDALEAQRNAMARAPIDGQMAELNSKVAKVQQERDAMALALRDSRSEHQKALAELATLRADTDNARRKAASLEQSLATERQVSNEVVAGLRNQLAALNESLKQKDKLLSAANVRTAQLERELEESRAEIAGLRDERDRLLKERDQMAALLRINESERVQLLIEQNMKLGRDLKQAQDRLAAVAADNDSTKDDLLTAKRDLAMAKGRIIELQRETTHQQGRLLQIESRLKEAGDELQAEATTTPDAETREEIEMLRGIIERQLRVQQRRRQAKELLFAEVKRLGVEDNAFMGALSMATGQELKLTDEENELLSDRKIDDEFVFSDHPSAEER